MDLIWTKKGTKKSIFTFIFIILLGSVAFIYPQTSNNIIDLFYDLGYNDEAQFLTKNQPSLELNSSSFKVVFCPYLNECKQTFSEVINMAQEDIKCALYELDERDIVLDLNEKSQRGVDVDLVIDDRYLEESVLKYLSEEVSLFSDIDRGTRYNNYMHHKFCVIDSNTTLVSSANPTENGFNYNNNNLQVFYSQDIADVFLEEFNQLSSGTFGYNKKPTISTSSFIFSNSTLSSLDIYICPQDNCEDGLIEVLGGANESIYFATFVMTLDSVEETLINKAQNGIEVQGVIEARSWNSQGSRAEEMQEQFELIKDKNPKTMHHKFFVVDERYVITGSMNPSNSGVNYNDENLLILDSPEIAQLFVEEFRRLQ